MIVVVLVLGEAGFGLSFALMVTVAAGLRWLLCRAGPPETSRQHTVAEKMATVALAWAMVALLSAIPFWLAPWTTGPMHNVATFHSILNGLFESVSGVTSTGLSMVAKPSELPASLQFWRTFTEWVGGVGIALLMITLMNPKNDATALFNTELNKNFADDAQQTARWIWKIYAGLSVFAVGLFLLLGMPAWQALNHGLTGIATGGFSVTDDSFNVYSVPIQTAASVIMIAGAISFAAYRLAIQRRNPLQLLRNGPVLALLSGVALATGLVWLARLEFEADGGFYAAFFQAVSAFATAGFSNADLSEWHSATLAILVMGMFIGGASGATTGGVKIDRILLLARGIGWRLQRQFGKRPGEEVRIGDESFSPETARLQVESAATLVALWMFTVLMGCLALSAVVGDEWTFTQVGFEVMSAISSVGLSTGITSAELPAAGKWILMLLMWAGRLEIFALLALLWLPLAGSSNKRK
jgi:trk system potassium uptake protein TrkH